MPLSARSTRAQSPGLPYWSLFARSLANLHSPAANPTGVVSLCVAENALSAPLVAERLAAVAAPAAAAPGQLGYDDMRGRAGLRAAFAALAQRRITGGARVDARHLTIASGCGALIQHLAFLLADAGDCALLVTPTYGALYNDMGVLAGVEVVDVPVAPGAAVRAGDLAAGSARARARCLRPRLLFFLHPDNPLGTVRRRAELRAVRAWARAQGPDFHLVSDEIYALSVYDEGEAGGAFESMAAVCAADFEAAAAAPAAPAPAPAPLYLGANTHVLWGASKDLCASGLRAGVLFSHSAPLLAALDNVGYFSAASNATQDALALALGDEGWVDAFLAANHARLREAREVVCAALARARVPFVRPHAGLFVWLDLSAWLPAAAEARGFAGERALTEDLFAAGVLLTPGEACHAAAPGSFRCCFAWHSQLESLRVGCQRLEAFLAARPRRDGAGSSAAPAPAGGEA
jgi:1-aminocyclopropane-1-carboxylate synthase